MARQSFKRLIRRLTPRSIRLARARATSARFNAERAGASVRDIFSEIYAENHWGGEPGEFFSGSGSVGQEDYAAFVRRFIAEHGVGSVLDLGCGDFQVGARLQVERVHYTGVDVVPALIARNAERFGGETVRFACLDAIEDALPPADLTIVRQVLQHLSNAQVARILDKLRGRRFCLITEHQPLRPASFNADKPPGFDIRLLQRSGLYLEKPPFSLTAARVVHTIPVAAKAMLPASKIVTYLLEGQA